MRFSFIGFVLIAIFVSCSSNVEKFDKVKIVVDSSQNNLSLYDTFREISNEKMRFILRGDSTFEFIYINRSDDPNSLYFSTNGIIKKSKDTLILNSNDDKIAHKNVILTYDTIKNSPYSKFTFRDIFEDSIGAWSVIYPDGKTRINSFDKGADIFRWQGNMAVNKYLDFNFSGYPIFRYFAPDSNVYNVKIKLLPQYIPDYFNRTIILQKNDSLIWNYKNGKRVFVRKR